jgi:hypothetical protein
MRLCSNRVVIGPDQRREVRRGAEASSEDGSKLLEPGCWDRLLDAPELCLKFSLRNAHVRSEKAEGWAPHRYSRYVWPCLESFRRASSSVKTAPTPPSACFFRGADRDFRKRIETLLTPA